MKRATLLVTILSVALSLPVFAQAERDVKTGGKDKETTLKLAINGGLDVAFAYDSEQLRETGQWINGGSADNEMDNPYYYFNGPAWISFWASLQDNVEMNITIRNIPFDSNDSFQDGGVGAGSQTNVRNRTNWGDPVGVAIKYAYMRIKELFDPAWSLSIGQMDVIWDIRGKGNAVFLDVAHAESPWGEIARAWATTVRTEQYPVGFKVTYARDQFNFELGLFPVISDAQNNLAAPTNQSRQQAIYYLSGVFGVDNQGSKIGGIFALFHGINPQDNVYSIGLGGLWVPQKDIEVFLEGYAQFGQPWSDANGGGGRGPIGGVPAAFAEDAEHAAFCFILGGRLDVPGETAAFIELHFLWVTGHDMGDATEFGRGNGFATGGANNDESQEFMSYENYDVMLLLNSNEWGYDFDNNILQITIQGGVMMSTGGSMKNNLHFILKLAYAVAPQEWEVAAAANHAADDPTGYGFEIDLVARWYMNKNANLYWQFGFLTGSEIIELFNIEEDDFAWIWLFGVQVSH